MNRDLYIDFAKGLATLSIIFIHTAFWSGQFYIPAEVRVFSLVFDVALFYALSGITSGSNIEKTFYRLLKLQITYMIFVTFLFFLDYFFKVFGLTFFSMDWLQHFYSTFGSKYATTSISTSPQWQNLGNWYLHQYTNADTFPVVMGSFWYLKVYFVLTVFGVLILKFFPKHINWFIGVCAVLTLLFNIFPEYYPTGQVSYVAFYLAVFLIGNRMRGKKIPPKTIPVLYAAVAGILAWMFWYYGNDIFYKINKNKFPPKIPYIIWAQFSLVTLFVLYNRLKITKENCITYIGKNAIFFYFAQGISSSLIYFLVVPLKENMPWWALMIIIYVINIILAFIISAGLKKIDSLGWNILELLRRKTSF
ncbi:acyltransferase [Chryseobacterium indologenes]|uniref:acyltransferase family protein n=1 Tax=Chryseobacterium indologenes TaxID=253 RepID=UPI000F4DF441|nr:acyltransferase family protein [Chryseobacterium indologenes]AYZ37942.1 acyltransferase [Chryseobacterium indologenes]MBF6646860.1 acyltransferase family protein [Chryseobacterium indologenes]MBU3050085.1 acyltransferase family protein [Chryseobacterium indologenes]MEB4763036.1 acyltransferase family protein [Chryseobacterium indologenes]QQQ69487.1 acyltransferase family protein [Chryseobacterium indologenes]